ncbi:MAG: 23S rRNA (guanosine(2251)-2'-O)-methyltransferase RlmB [Rhodobacteraceae bacterium]|nr:23S rRNA (guanosine(2251)-2'-O)-methyltransferase RlmB [Paracoccaceae bacterium]
MQDKIIRKKRLGLGKNSNRKKARNRYWVFGYHPVKAALLNPNRVFHRLILTQNAANKLQKDMGTLDHLKPEIRSSKFIADLLGSDATHQGFALEVEPLPEYGLSSLDLTDVTFKPVVLLDQVTDPQNVGAILRSTEAFFGKAVITTSRNTPVESGVLAKASSGAIERIPLIRVSNLSVAMKALKDKGCWLIGLDPLGEDELENVLQATSDVNIGFVMGAEGRGLRESVRNQCDYLAKITINSTIDSLNVSNATSICLYSAHVIRNRSN